MANHYVVTADTVLMMPMTSHFDSYNDAKNHAKNLKKVAAGKVVIKHVNEYGVEKIEEL